MSSRQTPPLRPWRRAFAHLVLFVLAVATIACGGPTVTTSWEAPHLTGPARDYLRALAAQDASEVRYQAEFTEGAELRVGSEPPDLTGEAALERLHFDTWGATRIGWLDDPDREFLDAYYCEVTATFDDGSTSDGVLYLCRADLGPHQDEDAQHEWRVIGVGADE